MEIWREKACEVASGTSENANTVIRKEAERLEIAAIELGEEMKVFSVTSFADEPQCAFDRHANNR
jgi:hypothetical protein